MNKKDRRPAWMGKPTTAGQLLKALAAVFIFIVMLYPVIYVVAGSFASQDSINAGQLIPTSFSIGAYEQIFAGGVVTRAMTVSIGITFVGTVLSMIMTSTLAYGLSRTRDMPFGRPMLMFVLLTMLFGAGMLPQYLLIKSLGMLDSYASLIIPGLISAFNMIVLRNAFQQVPEELLESAKLDGASDTRVFFTMILPLSTAVLAVIALFYAVGFWNSFFNAVLYITSPDRQPIQVVLNQYAVQGLPLPGAANGASSGVVVPPAPEAIKMAITVVATAPILLVFPFAQRFFTKGVLSGAIKG